MTNHVAREKRAVDSPIAEVAPDLYRLAIPLPNSPLKAVNVYAVLSSVGILLVDCGWNAKESYEALRAGLETIGGGIARLRRIVVTHIHPDHYGLAERLALESGARVSMHRSDAVLVGARYDDTRALVEGMTLWLRVNGTPADELDLMTRGSLQMLRLVGTRPPDVLLGGDEVIEWGRYRFHVLWTPGHAPGLICLHDAGEEILLSSDHVLQRISPHVGLHVQTVGDPLADYLDSLRAVRDLDVRLILPGHGKPFDDLSGRVDELVLHHRTRLEEMCEVVASGPQSAYEVASRLSWRGSPRGWENLEPFQRRMAVTEVIAHLEHLHARGRLHKTQSHGIAFFGETS